MTPKPAKRLTVRRKEATVAKKNPTAKVSAAGRGSSTVSSGPSEMNDDRIGILILPTFLDSLSRQPEETRASISPDGRTPIRTRN